VYITPASPVTLVDIDAQQAHRLAVRHASPHHHPEGGKLQEGKDTADDHHREEEVDQAPVGIDDRVLGKAQQHPQVHRAGHTRRRGLADRVGAEVGLDDLLQDDGKAKGHQDLVRVRALVEVPDQATLHHHADDQHHRYRQQQREGDRILDHRGAEIAEPLFDISGPDLERIA
jgi:hypothetical protein